MTTREWLDDRLGLAAIREVASHKTVPVHSATRWYYFGGITLFLFGVQMITGILLLFYYRPTVAEGFRKCEVHHDPRGIRLAHPLRP